MTELPPVQLSGDWSGTGDNRPRAFAAAGTEDVTVREYRTGRRPAPDPLALDRPRRRADGAPRGAAATRAAPPIMLDTRDSAHRGSGPASSFEYAVSAAASIGAHLAGQGFTLRLLTDEAVVGDATWHDRGISGSGVEVQLLLDSLAVIYDVLPQPHRRRVRRAQRVRPRRRGPRCNLPHRRRRALDAAGRGEPGARHRRSTSPPGLAPVGPPTSPHRPPTNRPRRCARTAGPSSSRDPGDRLPAIWKELGTTTATRRDFVAEAREAEEGPAA